jgi:hypothetical protein
MPIATCSQRSIEVSLRFSWTNPKISVSWRGGPLACQGPPRNWKGDNFVIAHIRPASNIPAAQRRPITTTSFRSCAVPELLSGFLQFDCCNRIQNRVRGCRHIAYSQKLLVVMMLGWLIGCASSVETSTLQRQNCLVLVGICCYGSMIRRSYTVRLAHGLSLSTENKRRMECL